MTSMVLVLVVAVVVTAVLISAIAWRYASDARRRDVARAALLRHAATSDTWDDRITPVERVTRDEPAPAAANELFAAEERRPASPAHTWIGAAAILVVIALVAATASMRESTPADASPALAATEATVGEPVKPAEKPAVLAPIALTALKHQRDVKGTLVVSGAIQNPNGAIALDHLMAVIDALDDAGSVIATVTAGVDAPVLLAGDATRFVVSIPRADDVARYRVRFRLRDGVVVEHKDQRKKEL